MLYNETILAQDVARDLGFDGLTSAFWAWCDKNHLPRELQLPRERVERALEKEGRI